MGIRCGSCVYRAETKDQRCNYFFITGHTRKGQPPEACTYYKQGKKREPAKEPRLPAPNKTRLAARKYDLDRAMLLWKAGATDREIALAIGSSLKHVAGWRHNNRLRVNPEPKANQKYDWDLAMELWENGATDREIAEAIGAEDPQRVGNWRRGKKLSANKKREA